MEAKKTPLVDLLHTVPKNATLSFHEGAHASITIPVGRLCLEAKQRIMNLQSTLNLTETALQEQTKKLERQIVELERKLHTQSLLAAWQAYEFRRYCKALNADLPDEFPPGMDAPE